MQIVTNWAVTNNGKACKWEADIDNSEQYIEIIFDNETTKWYLFIEEDSDPVVEESFDDFKELSRLLFAAADPSLEEFPTEEDFKNYCKKIKKEKNA